MLEFVLQELMEQVKFDLKLQGFFYKYYMTRYLPKQLLFSKQFFFLNLFILCNMAYSLLNPTDRLKPHIILHTNEFNNICKTFKRARVCILF